MSSSDLESRGDQRSMGMQWYIIHTYSGFEKKVKESLESRVAAFSLQDKIGRVLIPMEEVVEVRGGKKVVSSRMSYLGDVTVAAERSGSGRNHQSRAHAAGPPEAESDLRAQRAGAHCRWPLCEFQRQRRGD